MSISFYKISGIGDEDLGSSQNITYLDIQKVYKMYGCLNESE